MQAFDEVFCLQLQIPSSFFVPSDGAYGNQGVYAIQRGDFGRRKDKIRNALPAGKRREMGKGKYKGKQARVGGRYKKN